MVNDSEGREFQCKRGLRQRDPISPLLFVLVANVFTRIINLDKEHNVVQNLENFENRIISFQYANNAILFSVTEFEKLKNLKLLMYISENVSGLNITFSKTEVIWFEGVRR